MAGDLLAAILLLDDTCCKALAIARTTIHSGKSNAKPAEFITLSLG